MRLFASEIGALGHGDYRHALIPVPVKALN